MWPSFLWFIYFAWLFFRFFFFSQIWNKENLFLDRLKWLHWVHFILESIRYNERIHGNGNGGGNRRHKFEHIFCHIDRFDKLLKELFVWHILETVPKGLMWLSKQTIVFCCELIFQEIMHSTILCYYGYG